MQRLTWAIDLDNAANAVTIKNNTVESNFNGMQIHNGFNNLIAGNRFSKSVQAHIQMAEGGSTASVRNNTVRNNVFSSLNGEQTYRLSSSLGATSVAQFGIYDANDYTSSSPAFANFSGQVLSYTQWKTRTGQDATSVFRTP
jgi:parallel beta-helix repeat protein